MSNNDLIRRSSVLGTLIANYVVGNLTKEALDLYTQEINAITSAPQEMTAREYIKQQFRMCMTQSDGVKCEGCPLSPSVTGEYCDTYEVLHPEQAVAIVEKWAREHPEVSE